MFSQEVSCTFGYRALVSDIHTTYLSFFRILGCSIRRISPHKLLSPCSICSRLPPHSLHTDPVSHIAGCVAVGQRHPHPSQKCSAAIHPTLLPPGSRHTGRLCAQPQKGRDIRSCNSVRVRSNRVLSTHPKPADGSQGSAAGRGSPPGFI